MAVLYGANPDDEAVADHARMAAHFGALVLGYEGLAGLTVALLDIRIAAGDPRPADKET